VVFTVVITDESIGVSQLSVGHVPWLPPNLCLCRVALKWNVIVLAMVFIMLGDVDDCMGNNSSGLFEDI